MVKKENVKPCWSSVSGKPRWHLSQQKQTRQQHKKGSSDAAKMLAVLPTGQCDFVYRPNSIFFAVFNFILWLTSELWFIHLCLHCTMPTSRCRWLAALFHTTVRKGHPTTWRPIWTCVCDASVIVLLPDILLGYDSSQLLLSKPNLPIVPE